MKKPNLERHFRTEHPQLAGKDRLFFERKRQNLNTQKLDITGGVHRQNAALVEASFVIAYQIAKKKKPHTIAEELVMPCMKDVVRILIGPEQAKLLSGVSVSDNTVQRRIVDLSEDIEKRVITEIKSSPFYAIASDESTDVASLSQLMVWVRYLFENDFKDEPLFFRPSRVDYHWCRCVLEDSGIHQRGWYRIRQTCWELHRRCTCYVGLPLGFPD